MAGSARTCAERGLQPAALLLCLAAPPALAQNATGDPTITGAHRVGEELTVATDAIADPDGIVNATFAYRWIRVDDEGAETDIAGAIAATYTLAPADEGGQVRVRVTFTDDGGNTEERTSNAYPSSGAILPEAVCDVPSYIGGEREIWSAELTIGHFNEDTTEVYGFFEGLVGDLSDRTVRIPGSGEYGIENVNYFDLADDQDSLILYLAPVPTDGVEQAIDRVSLFVCDRRFAWRDGASDLRPTSLEVDWGVDLEWSALSKRTLRMSYDDVAPEFVSATLHGGILEVTFSEPLRSAYVSFDVTVQRRRLGSVTVVNAPGAASGISTVFALVLCHG